jgi:hypothetical protein
MNNQNTWKQWFAVFFERQVPLTTLKLRAHYWGWFETVEDEEAPMMGFALIGMVVLTIATLTL